MRTVRVRIGDGQVEEVEVDGTTGVDLIRQFELPTSSVLLLADEVPVPDDEELDEKVEYTVINVMSGG